MEVLPSFPIQDLNITTTALLHDHFKGSIKFVAFRDTHPRNVLLSGDSSSIIHLGIFTV
jgi:hypothetical protein